MSSFAKSFAFALLLIGALVASARAEPERPIAGGEDSPVDVICELIGSSARAQDLPTPFLTRLIWQESNFKSRALSPAGAQGIAQFMPGAAAERGLAEPFDPEKAIPQAASLLADLKKQFGNLGLAAAAYNAGPGRVTRWLSGDGPLPIETEDYVAIITRHPADAWRGADAAKLTDEAVFPEASCVQIVAAARRAAPSEIAHSMFWAPWGVQLSGSFSKAAALRAFERARVRYGEVLAGVEPMILGGRLRSRGFRAFFRVRAPAATRAEANALCSRILKVGGACVVLRS